MSILIDNNTRVIVQSYSSSRAMGGEARFHLQQMVEYGTQVVGVVNAGKGGERVDGVPVFDTVSDAVEQTGATASANFVPAPFAADTIMEAADADLPLVVCISENIPVLDMLKAKHYLADKNTRLIGPNCPGPDFSGQVQNRHYARRNSPRRSHWRHFAQRHAHL